MPARGIAAEPKTANEVPAAINRTDPLPYYAQLARILRSAISEGVYKPGNLLPSESDLCERYGVSRTAVRQALDELVAEGLVAKEKGKGTFVAVPKLAFVIQELRGFYDEMSEQGLQVKTQILRKEVALADPAVAEALQVAAGSEVVLIERVRGIDDLALVHVVTYLPMPRFRKLLDVDISGKSLYSLLKTSFNVEPRVGRRQIEAEAANRDLATLLGVDVGAPMIKMTSIGLDQRDRPFEIFIAWYRGDHTTFDLDAS